jgi:hypothetical protein
MNTIVKGMLTCLMILVILPMRASGQSKSEDAGTEYRNAYAAFQKDIDAMEARVLQIRKSDSTTINDSLFTAQSVETSQQDILQQIREAGMQHTDTYQALLLRSDDQVSSDMKVHEKAMLQTLNTLTDALVEYEMLQLKARKGGVADTTVIRLGSSKIIIIDDGENKKNSYQYLREQDEKKETPKQAKQIEMSTLGVSLGLNTFMYKYDLNLPLKYSDLDIKGIRSWNVNVRLLEAKVNMYKHRINILSGISVDWNNYRFSNNTQFSARTDTMMMSRDTIEYRKNKFMTQNLMGHFMLQYETRPDKNGRTFDIGAGVFGGYLMNARMKQVSEQNGKVKMDDDYQLNPLRYGICGRIGYGAFDFYVNYTLNNLFRENLGPQVQNISFGINITAL